MVVNVCSPWFYYTFVDDYHLNVIYMLQTKTHVCLITDYYAGGELFMLLDRQPMKVLKEDAVRWVLTLKLFLLLRFSENSLCFSVVIDMLLWSLICLLLHNIIGSWIKNPRSIVDVIVHDYCRFYAAEVVTTLEYLHCQGSHICHTNYINEILFGGGR